jgi:hypothetical protein
MVPYSCPHQCIPYTHHLLKLGRESIGFLCNASTVLSNKLLRCIHPALPFLSVTQQRILFVILNLTAGLLANCHSDSSGRMPRWFFSSIDETEWILSGSECYYGFLYQPQVPLEAGWTLWKEWEFILWWVSKMPQLSSHFWSSLKRTLLGLDHWDLLAFSLTVSDRTR